MQLSVRRLNLSKYKFVPALILFVVMLSHPQAAVDAAQNSMAVWYASVAPALFPFLALMPLLTGPEACAIYESMFAPLMSGLFRLPGSAAPAMFIALLAGSPAGAAAIAATAGKSKMTVSQLRRFAPVVCGVGPAYLVAGVGAGLLGSAQMGLKLAGVQLAVQLSMLLALRFLKDDAAESVPVIPAHRSPGGIRAAVESVLAVCGYMVLFSGASAAAAQMFGKNLGNLILTAADLPSGMALIAKSSLKGRVVFMGMAAGFGGFCIMAQNMEHLKPLGVRWKDMLRVKFAQSALCGAACSFVFGENAAVTGAFSMPVKITYAFSLLLALIFCLPVLNSLSKKLFLNKRKPAGNFSS